VKIEHVLDQRAVQSRDAALQHHEARAGDAARRLEVDQRELLADRDVIQRREVERPRGAPAANFDVRGFVAAVRNAFVQRVRQAEDDLLELGTGRRLFFLQAFELAGERLALGDECGDVLPLALGHADLLRVGIARRAGLVGGDLGGLAPLLERAEATDVEHEPASREVAGDGVGVSAEQPGVEHGGIVLDERVGIIGECPYFLRRASASRILISSPRSTGS
jgi:hypothetical protein